MFYGGLFLLPYYIPGASLRNFHLEFPKQVVGIDLVHAGKEGQRFGRSMLPAASATLVSAVIIWHLLHVKLAGNQVTDP